MVYGVIFAFHFVPLNLVRQLPVSVLKGCSSVGEPLCRLCETSTFRGRADFDVDDCHIFPQGMLTTISIVVSDTGDGLARAGIQYEAGLSLCSVTISPEPNLGLSPSCWSPKCLS